MDDQVHQALARLWELLRKPELSSELARTLGRAVRRVDASRVALDEGERREQLAEGVAELQAALGLIEESANASDRAQQSVLELALRLLGPRPAAAIGAGGARPGGRGAGASGGQTDPAQDERAVGKQIELLGDLCRHRVRLLANARLPWQTLAEADLRIERAARGLKWITPRVRQSLEAAGEESEPIGWDFAQAATLLQIGEPAQIEAALAGAEKAGLADGEIWAGTLSALSLPERPEAHAAVKALFARTEHSALRALWLPWLFERQLVPPADLVGLLSGKDEALAAAAADLLTWVAGRDYGPLFFQRGQSARPGIRGSAFLRAAGLLGSAPALEEMRKSLDAGEPDLWFVAALGAMGDARDVARLKAIAEKGGAAAPLAELAAGQVALPRSLDTASQTLRNPAAAVHARFWAASFIAAQTGHRLGAIYRPDASASRQQRVARAWEAHLAKAGQNRAPGAPRA